MLFAFAANGRSEKLNRYLCIKQLRSSGYGLLEGFHRTRKPYTRYLTLLLYHRYFLFLLYLPFCKFKSHIIFIPQLKKGFIYEEI